MCRRVRRLLDDPGRLTRDEHNSNEMRNILWDVKHGKHAGKWKRVNRFHQVTKV